MTEPGPSPDDRLADPPDDPRAFAASLAADLRAWIEWAALTGATEVPLPERASIDVAPPPIDTRGDVAAPRVAPVAPGPRTPAAPGPRTPADRSPSAPARATPTRTTAPPLASPVSPRAANAAHPIAPPPSTPVSAGAAGLAQVRAELGDCQRCRLGKDRKHLVFGVGNAEAELVLVGEAPGQQEDLVGEPFVGRAGGLLTKMLAAIGLAREQVYICNVIKCRPPQNRDPLSDEVASCSPFLHRQLAAIQPKVIMTLGRFAGATVGGVEVSLAELRRRRATWNGVPIISTYHPSYLLRTPHMKRAAWEDLLAVRALLRAAGK